MTGEPGDTDQGAAGEQLALMRSTARRARARPPKPPVEAAAVLPVARVAVDVSLPHLDRPFDYLVTADQAEDAQPGCRVRVRFAGRLVDGFLLDRVGSTEHGGRLAPLHKVVSPEPVLSPEVARLAREVADHYAGSLADVLRLAVPPRHARAEAAGTDERAPCPDLGHPRADPQSLRLAAGLPRPDAGPWTRYPRGPALLDAVHAGGAPRAVWSALPGAAWPDEIARLVATAVAGGRGALVVVPDHRDVDRVDRELADLLGPGQHVRLTADQGPQARYTAWLKVLRGHVRCVVGTRAAAFAPLRDLGLVAW